MCGEKESFLERGLHHTGSPPHVRGKVKKAQKSIQETRITPACAGKSLTSLILIRAIWDHPRMCGEKIFFGLVSDVP